MNHVAPLRLTPDGAKLLANTELLRLSKELSEAYASKEILVTDEFLQVIGTMLWRSLDVGERFSEAKRNAGQGILPVIIESDDAAVHQLPWETRFHPEYGFLARNKEFTLVRTSSAITVKIPEEEAGPLRILLFSSLPDDLDENEQLQIENEQAGVIEALGEWVRKGYVVLEMPDDGRFDVFEERLQAFKPHLVWLSGHGVFQKNLLDGGGKGYFLFEGEEDGKGELVDESMLADSFSGTSVQALVLSACQSGKAVSTDLNNGLMFKMAAKGVPHVIAMRESIFDRAGVQFARSFFMALLDENGSLAVALQQGRSAIRRPFEHDERFKDSLLAGLSFGQWCLPALLSHEHDRSLVDWQFTPKAMREKSLLNESLNDITFPKRFIGRRRELRALQRSLRDGSKRALLITGAGGMGKTALAGKLVQSLQQDGCELFGFSAREGKDWKQSILQMELALDEPFSRKYSSINLKDDPAKQASLLLKLLLMQYGKKMALLFDNLESVQDPASRTLTDMELKIWIDAACALQAEGLRVVLTSRWALPDWSFAEQQLVKPVWRDFLAVVQQMKWSQNILGNYVLLHRIYEVLGGNFRAVEFFAGAIKKMNVQEEDAFLQALDGVQEEMQANMALDKIWQYRSEQERELLRRMVAYQVPVSLDGVGKIALPEQPEYEKALHELLSVSLVEQYGNTTRKAVEYLVAPLVRSWLDRKGVEPPSTALLQRAAGYHQWLLEHERRTLDQAMITHAALMAAGQNDEAHRIALDRIVTPMNRAGLYRSILDNWLLPACNAANPATLSEALGQTGKQYHHLADYDTALDYLKRSLKIRQEIGDKSGEGTTLNNISQIYDARGDYDTALDYLKRSLKIQQEIGDKSGEGTTLNNIANIYLARGDYDTALDYLKRSLKIQQEIGDKSGLCATLFNMGHIYWQNEDQQNAVLSWVTVYQIAKNINLAQALQALESLAGSLGLPGGLDGWEQLSRQMGENDGGAES
jgi:tetratricopeptide (TPR) repeat protein